MDDGVALYSLGNELDLPEGESTDSTPALSAPSTAEARAHPVVYDIPVEGRFTSGTMLLGAAVHSGRVDTPDLSFQLTAELVPDPDHIVVSAGSEWTYRYTPGPVPDYWTHFGYWSYDKGDGTGKAPFGFGSPVVATNLDIQPVSARPLTAYFMLSRRIGSDKRALGDLEITTWANDGLVLYLNGKEIKRVNMPAGPVTNTTYATAAPWTALAYRNLVKIVIPNDQVPDAGMTITAQVHLNRRGTTDMTFDLTARFTGTT